DLKRASKAGKGFIFTAGGIDDGKEVEEAADDVYRYKDSRDYEEGNGPFVHVRLNDEAWADEARADSDEVDSLQEKLQELLDEEFSETATALSIPGFEETKDISITFADYDDGTTFLIVVGGIDVERIFTVIEKTLRKSSI